MHESKEGERVTLFSLPGQGRARGNIYTKVCYVRGSDLNKTVTRNLQI